MEEQGRIQATAQIECETPFSLSMFLNQAFEDTIFITRFHVRIVLRRNARIE